MTALTFTRTVDTDPHAAFSAWTDPAQLANWWWPQWPDTEYDADVRVGGTFRIHSAQVGVGVRGEFLTIDRPHGFMMTWVWVEDDSAPANSDPAFVDTVQVTFVAIGGQTEVTVVHSTNDGAENYRQGWSDVLTRLPGLK